MTRNRGAARAAALMLVAFAGIGGACAAPRTFVAAYGNDADVCSRAAPCRSFAMALSHTDASGEVIVLDSAGYGTVSVAQSVSIIAPPGVYAGISVFSGDGITVNGAAVNVVLKGLTINGQGGANGITFAQGTSLTIEGCIVRNMGVNNILLATGVTSIHSSTASGSAGTGIRIDSGAKATIADAHVESNAAFGIWLLQSAHVSIERSVIAKNALSGINVYTGNPTTSLVVTASTIADHPAGDGIGVQAVAPSTSAGLDISGNTIARNDNGINASASVGGSTVVNAANNQISDSVLAGILANGPGARVYARGNAIFRGQYGLYTTGGAIYSPGDNYVRDATIQDDSTHTGDTLL